MAREIGIGLAGYGGIGRMHALCYRMLPLTYPDLPVASRIVAVATASAASAERARRELGDGLAVDRVIAAALRSAGQGGAPLDV